MRQALLVSKELGLRLASEMVDSDGEFLILHPNDDGDARSVLDGFRRLASRPNVALRVVPGPTMAEQALAGFHPDAIFVCGWYWLISQKSIGEARLGAYGLHNSLLPKYRGGSPLVWSIIQGDKEVGSTLFKLSAGMDDGPIVDQCAFSLAEKSIGDAIEEINHYFSRTIQSTWHQILQGSAVVRPQNHLEATYCASRIAADGRISWHWDAMTIRNFVRAQSSPYPGAFTDLAGERVLIESVALSPRPMFATPGQIVGRGTGGSVTVACGRSETLEILALRDSLGRAPAEVLSSLHGGHVPLSGGFSFFALRSVF